MYVGKPCFEKLVPLVWVVLLQKSNKSLVCQRFICHGSRNGSFCRLQTCFGHRLLLLRL